MTAGTGFDISDWFAITFTSLCPKNDTDVGRCNFEVRRPMLIFFGRIVAETVNYQNCSLFSHLT